MPTFDFTFEAQPRYADAALKCLLRRRLGCLGPSALVLLLILVWIFAQDPYGNAVIAWVFGGAALMLLLLFLLAVQRRRQLTRRFYREASHRNVHVVIDDDGVAVTTALGATRLSWRVFERVWKCEDVTLLIHSGWQYFGIPTHAFPPGAVDFAEARIADKRNG